jgi:hypothetical protein
MKNGRENTRDDYIQIFKEYGFEREKKLNKSDEYKNIRRGVTLYFFWNQGSESELDIAISPYFDYTPLLRLTGVRFKSSSEAGIRFGTSMMVFPREYENHIPAGSQSKVGRMFSIKLLNEGADRFQPLKEFLAVFSGVTEHGSISENEPFPSTGVNGIRQPMPLSSDPERDLVLPVNVQSSLESDTQSLKTDEREAVVKVRFGQGNFREALFNEKNHGARCWMSGIEGGRLLIASHIKPWSHCENDANSRGRTDNGLLLSALWDAAFDAGLVGFDFDWNVVASSELTESARRALCLDKYSALPEKFRTVGRKAYLAYHLANVFEYWKKKDLA